MVCRSWFADHWRESYVSETGKSMKGVDLAAGQPGDGWRKIAISRIDLVGSDKQPYAVALSASR
jgi:hypothetical protein